MKVIVVQNTELLLSMNNRNLPHNCKKDSNSSTESQEGNGTERRSHTVCGDSMGCDQVGFGRT